MRSLRAIMEDCPTKTEFIAALKPEVRSIQFGLTAEKSLQNEALVDYITSVLVMLCNCVEYHQHNFEIVMTYPVDGNKLKERKEKLTLISSSSVSSKGRVRNSEDKKDFSNYKVSIFLSLLQTIKSSVKKNEVRTIRDVYYGNVELYRKQEVVTHWLNNIQKTLSLRTRNDLNIVPAQKGLCFIPFKLEIFNKLTGNTTTVPKNKSSLIPYITESCEFLVNEEISTKILKVMVLEKEAVYNKLVNYAPESNNLNHSIIVTGKGYPDFLTRLFLNKLQDLEILNNSSWEIYTDADPAGISISSKYTINRQNDLYSCKKLVHKGAKIIKLIGNLNEAKHGQLLDLSNRDIPVLIGLLNNLTDKHDTDVNHSYMVTELQRQLFFAKKGEMNSLEFRAYEE